MSDNLLKIENPEQEGYTVREENDIKYIEKKEIINHEKHGECVSFFQQQIQIDENNNTIIKQRNDYHKNNPESTIIESNVVTFENEKLKDKVIENYTNGQLTRKIINDKKTETIINYYEDEKEKLVKEINVLDLSHNLYIYRSKQDKKGNFTFQLNSEKIIEHEGEEYPLEQIYNIISNGEYSKTIYLANDKFIIRKNFNSKGDLINKETTDKDKGVVTTEYYTNGQLTQQVTNDKKTETTIKFYEDEKEKLVKEIEILDLSHNLYIYRSKQDKKGNVTFQLNSEKIIEHEGEEYPLEQIYNIISNGEYSKVIYLANDKFTIIKKFNSKGNLIKKETTDEKTGIITTERKNILGDSIIIVEDKNSNVTTIKIYDKSGNKTYISEKNKNTGIENTTSYDNSGNIDSITEENKNTGIKIYTRYDKSGNIDSIREENKNTGIEIYISYDKLGNKTYISEENKNTGIEISTSYYPESDKINYISEKNKNTGIENTTYYNKSGTKTRITEESDEYIIDTYYDEYERERKYSKENKKTGITNIKEYYEFGNIKSISEENKETGISKETKYYETGKIKSISEENKETGISKKTLNDESEKTKTISIKNEKTGITNTKEYKESGNEIILYHKDKTIIETYRTDNSLSKRVTMTDKEIISMNFDMRGEFKNVSRKLKNSDIGIEEYFEKGKLFPIFKVNDMEIPLVSLDKYKEVCKKYNIEPLPEVLAGHEPPRPPAQPKSTI